jgi:hypothetical protein
MKSMFNKFLPKSLVEAVANDKMDISDAVPKEIEIILVRIDEAKTDALNQTVSDVIEFGNENGAMIEDIVSSFVVLSYGAIGNEVVRKGRGHELATLLLKKLESKVAVIYGREICLVGNHGSKNRMKYGSLLPNFWELMGRLSKMKLGSKESI